MFCTSCGAQLPENSTFCTNCGKPIGAPASAGGGPSISFNANAPDPNATFVPPDKVEVRIGAWIGAGWEIVKADLLNLVLMTLLVAIVGGAVPVLLQGAMAAGFYLVFMKKTVGAKTDFGDLFKGFNWFVPTLLATIVIGVLTCLGAIACLVGALVVHAMFSFTYLFIIDRKMDFWPAMQASHSIVKKDYFGFTLFVLALAGVQILGVLCCIVGVLVTIPISYAAITVAYKELAGYASNPAAN